MENLSSIHLSPQQRETLNGIEKLKWLAKKIEETKCTSQDEKLDVRLQSETSAPSVTYQGSEGLWSPRRQQLGRFKGETKQLYLPHGDPTLPSMLFPSFTQQNNNIRPLISVAEVLPPSQAVSGPNWKSPCVVASKYSNLVPSTSHAPNAETNISKTSVILPVLRELHRLKTIINAHSRESELSFVHSHTEGPGGVKTSDELSGSEDGHTSGESRGGDLGISSPVTESGSIVNATEHSEVQECAVSDIFNNRINIENPSRQWINDDQKEGHLNSLKGLEDNSSEAVCGTGKESVRLRESASSNGDQQQSVLISRVCFGKEEVHNDSTPSPHQQINMGTNPFNQHGFQPFKLLEVRKLLKENKNFFLILWHLPFPSKQPCNWDFPS